MTARRDDLCDRHEVCGNTWRNTYTVRRDSRVDGPATWRIRLCFGCSSEFESAPVLGQPT